jgi:hypothetical protein
VANGYSSINFKMKKLKTYLTAGFGAAVTCQSADAATLVTLYGPGARNPSSSVATPAGIDFGTDFNKYLYNVIDAADSGKSIFASDKVAIFTNGTDLSGIASAGQRGAYTFDGDFFAGAMAGGANYANISFDGDSLIFEAVGQFSFDGAGGGYLIALAINDDGSALSISEGKAAIDAVPEPSALALLSLGAGALMTRRRRKMSQ